MQKQISLMPWSFLLDISENKKRAHWNFCLNLYFYDLPFKKKASKIVFIYFFVSEKYEDKTFSRISDVLPVSDGFVKYKFTSLRVHRFPNSGKGWSVPVHPWAPPHTPSITLRVGNLIAEVFLLSLNLHSCCKTDVPERECGLLISYTEKDEADGTQRETDSLGPDFLCINKFPQAPVDIWHHIYGIVVILKSLGRLHIQHDT